VGETDQLPFRLHRTEAPGLFDLAEDRLHGSLATGAEGSAFLSGESFPHDLCDDGLPDGEEVPLPGEGSDGGCGGVGSVWLLVAQPPAASAASNTSPVLPTLRRCIKRFSDGGRGESRPPRVAFHDGLDSPRRAGFNASRPRPRRPLARRQ